MVQFLHSKIYTLITLSAIVGIGGVVMVRSAQDQQPREPPRVDPSIATRQNNARREGGLRAAAAVTGTFVGTIDYPTVGGPANLKDLVEMSALIVVGSASGNVSRPTADGRSVGTFYQVEIENVLKGRHDPDKTVTVILLGGRIGFPDGSSAQLNARGVARPRPGARIALFLREAPDEMTEGNQSAIRGGQAYVPVAGPLGMYDLSMSQLPFVFAAGFHQNPLAKRIVEQRLRPDSFLMMVRETVEGERTR